MRQLFGLDRDVAPLGVLVALHNLGALHDLIGSGGLLGRLLDGRRQHLLVPHALAGCAVNLMKLDVTLRLSCDEKFDAELHQRDLYLSTPIGPCHRAVRLWAEECAACMTRFPQGRDAREFASRSSTASWAVQGKARP